MNSIMPPTFEAKHSISLASRDRLVVRTLRCGRSNPGSNPGHGMLRNFFLSSIKGRKAS